MALIVHFAAIGMNDKKYAEVLRRLEAAGGIDVGRSEVVEVHNIIRGLRTSAAACRPRSSG
jgi:hypothetical protein